jgi:hypothetical protein
VSGTLGLEHLGDSYQQPTNKQDDQNLESVFLVNHFLSLACQDQGTQFAAKQKKG